MLQLAPNVLLIPGTRLAHLRENLAAEHVTIDGEARRDLSRLGACRPGQHEPSTSRPDAAPCGYQVQVGNLFAMALWNIFLIDEIDNRA
jgi:hypothetical protein